MKQIALSLFVIAASGAYVWDQAGNKPSDDMLGSSLPANAADMQDALPEGRVSIAVPETRNQPKRFETQFGTRFHIGKETSAGTSVRLRPPLFRAAHPFMTRAAAPATSPREVADPVPTVSEGSAASFAVVPAAYVPLQLPTSTNPDAPARVVVAGMKLAAGNYGDGVYTGPEADAYYGIIQLQALVQGGRLTALKILQYPSDRRTSIRINRQALPMLRDEAISAQGAEVDIISGATLTSRAFVRSLRGALKQAL